MRNVPGLAGGGSLDLGTVGVVPGQVEVNGDIGGFYRAPFSSMTLPAKQYPLSWEGSCPESSVTFPSVPFSPSPVTRGSLCVTCPLSVTPLSRVVSRGDPLSSAFRGETGR